MNETSPFLKKIVAVKGSYAHQLVIAYSIYRRNISFWDSRFAEVVAAKEDQKFIVCD